MLEWHSTIWSKWMTTQTPNSPLQESHLQQHEVEKSWTTSSLGHCGKNRRRFCETSQASFLPQENKVQAAGWGTSACDLGGARCSLHQIYKYTGFDDTKSYQVGLQAESCTLQKDKNQPVQTKKNDWTNVCLFAASPDVIKLTTKIQINNNKVYTQTRG